MCRCFCLEDRKQGAVYLRVFLYGPGESPNGFEVIAKAEKSVCLRELVFFASKRCSSISPVAICLACLCALRSGMSTTTAARLPPKKSFSEYYIPEIKNV